MLTTIGGIIAPKFKLQNLSLYMFSRATWISDSD